MDTRNELLDALGKELVEQARHLQKYAEVESINANDENFTASMAATKSVLENFHDALNEIIKTTPTATRDDFSGLANTYGILSQIEARYQSLKEKASSEKIPALNINRAGEEKLITDATKRVEENVEKSERVALKEAIAYIESDIANITTINQLITFHQNLAVIKNPEADVGDVETALRNIGYDDKEDDEINVNECAEDILKENRSIAARKDKAEEGEEAPHPTDDDDELSLDDEPAADHSEWAKGELERIVALTKPGGEHENQSLAGVLEEINKGAVISHLAEVRSTVASDAEAVANNNSVLQDLSTRTAADQVPGKIFGISVITDTKASIAKDNKTRLEKSAPAKTTDELAQEALDNMLTRVAEGGSTPNEHLLVFINENQAEIKDALKTIFEENDTAEAHDDINIEVAKILTAEKADDCQGAYFGQAIPDATKTAIAQANHERKYGAPVPPLDFNKVWAEGQFNRLHGVVDAGGKYPNDALHSFMDTPANKAALIRYLADIRSGAADDKPAQKNTDEQFIKFLKAKKATNVPNTLFGVDVDAPTKEAIAAGNVALKEPKKAEAAELDSTAKARSLFNAESYREVQNNLRVAHGGDFDRYQRYALAVSSLENLNRDTESPMSAAESAKHLKNLQGIIKKLEEFKIFLKQAQQDKKLSHTDANKLNADYRKLINGKPDAHIERLLDQIEEALQKLYLAKDKVQRFNIEGTKTDQRSFGTSYSISQEEVFSATDASTKTYQAAMRKLNDSLNTSTSKDPSKLVNSGGLTNEEKALATTSKDNKIVAFKVTVTDKRKNTIETGSIRTHNTKNNSARVEFVMPQASEKKLTGFFSGKMNFGGSRLPAMATMEWAAQNIQSLRSVMRIKSQPIRILPNTKKELIDALVLYCKHKGYAYETPTWYKDNTSKQKVADFGQRWKQDHPEDIGKRTAERLEERVAPRPGRS